ncbi:hypothetical protein BH23PLA1_BH23PLA1_13680 [soil metagenome]
MKFSLLSTLLICLAMTLPAVGQTENQPKVTPGPNEPDWVAILQGLYGLDMFEDLANPVETTPEATPGLFRKVGPGPVICSPIMALGLETTTRCGWYLPGEDPGQPQKKPLWAYTFKNTARDIETGSNLPPPLEDGSTTRFDPGDELFGFFVSNDGFDDGGVYTEPAVVKAVNERLASQPYKAMIYPNKDPQSGHVIPNSYFIGWEYSTNDDFQDVVIRVDNAKLVEPEE